MKEGLWEITSKTEMPGMPFAMPATTFKQCITKKDLVPQGKNTSQQSCKMIDNKISGNTVTWTMICDQGGTSSKSTGKISYNGTTFSGEMKMQTSNPRAGGMMDITTTMTGKRISDCR